MTVDGQVIHSTYLGVTIGKQIKNAQKRIAKYPNWPGDDPDNGNDVPTAPADETCPQTVARQRRELAQARAIVAVQQTVMRAQRDEIAALRNGEALAKVVAELEQERALRARDRRLELAKRRLRRCKSLKAGQCDVIEAVARIATERARYFGTDTPIVTAKNIADKLGTHESTPREIAEKVCSLPGSPIQRTTAYREDGKRGKLTTYALDVNDPAEIIERYATIGEALDAEDRKVTRTTVHCPEHPKAGTRELPADVL